MKVSDASAVCFHLLIRKTYSFVAAPPRAGLTRTGDKDVGPPAYKCTRLSVKSSNPFFAREKEKSNRSNSSIDTINNDSDTKKISRHVVEQGDADRRQLLGLPGAATPNDETALWKIRLQLMKPITWVPLAAGVMCGAAASGNYHWMWNPFDPADRDVALGLQDATKGLLTMILAGPFMEGYSQTINDWYDRDIDAVNEPYRPIPSGAISKQQVLEQILFLVSGSLALAYGIDVLSGHAFPIVLACALAGTLVGYVYSAPPLRLKRNGWSGDIAIGLCYIALPWWCGHAAFGQLDKPVLWLLPTLYSLSGIGPAIANDFKSIEGDKEFGVDSIPVMYGIDVAKWFCAAAQTLPQLAAAMYLYSVGERNFALALVALLFPQLFYIKTLLLPDPIENGLKFQASCQPFFVFSLVLTALCMGQHDWSAHP